MKRCPKRYTTTPKRDKIPQKNGNLLVRIVELSTAVVKVDIKVINASLTQNQCLQCVTPSLMQVEIPRPCDATELNNDGMIKLGYVCYQTEPILSFFFKRYFINDTSSFYSHLLSAIDLQCHVFLFEKLLFNVRLCLLKAFLMTSCVTSSPGNDFEVLG